MKRYTNIKNFLYYLRYPKTIASAKTQEDIFKKIKDYIGNEGICLGDHDVLYYSDMSPINEFRLRHKGKKWYFEQVK